MDFGQERTRSAFTLIELSIVLVIIGLIVGGVLAGRDLIGSATLRAQVSQIEKYNQAVNTFKGKYGCLPGDCPNASALFPTLASDLIGLGSINGNGNDLLEDQYGGSVAPGGVAGEHRYFWTDLFAAGMTDCCKGSIYNIIGQDFPLAKYGNNGIAAMALSSKNGYFLGVNKPSANCCDIGYDQVVDNTNGPMTPGQAQAFDKKTDDGKASSGKIYPAWRYGGDQLMYMQPYLAGFHCLNNATPPDYDTSYTATACSPFVIMQ